LTSLVINKASKSLCRFFEQHDGWFPLDKAKSGSLQLRIKVFLEDFVAAAMVENAVKKVDISVYFLI
jgi:hypothetical protein